MLVESASYLIAMLSASSAESQLFPHLNIDGDIFSSTLQTLLTMLAYCLTEYWSRRRVRRRMEMRMRSRFYDLTARGAVYESGAWEPEGVKTGKLMLKDLFQDW